MIYTTVMLKKLLKESVYRGTFNKITLIATDL